MWKKCTWKVMFLWIFKYWSRSKSKPVVFEDYFFLIGWIFIDTISSNHFDKDFLFKYFFPLFSIFLSVFYLIGKMLRTLGSRLSIGFLFWRNSHRMPLFNYYKIINLIRWVQKKSSTPYHHHFKYLQFYFESEIKFILNLSVAWLV